MNLIEKSPREFLEFNYYLERISDSIPSPLRWYFDFKLYEFDSLSDSVKNIIARVYPNVDLERATTEKITFAEMLERGITGDFAFVIIDEQTRQILFFSGGDCD